METWTTPEFADHSALAWHYTSTVGLKGIIENHVVWATSAAFMNDADELKSGITALRGYFDKQKDSLSDAERSGFLDSGVLNPGSVFENYLLSASRDSDNLNLWRNYVGDEVGYAVGFRRDSRLVPMEQREGDSHPAPPPKYYDGEWDEDLDGHPFNIDPDPDQVLVQSSDWTDVVYIDGPNHAAVVDKFNQLESAFSEYERGRHFVLFPDNLVPSWKNAGFSSESEVRMLAPMVYPTWKFVKHRPSRFGLIPYIELTAEPADGEDRSFATTRAPLPIEEIVIGPTTYRDDATRSLRLLLDISGYGSVKIRTSETPFR